MRNQQLSKINMNQKKNTTSKYKRFYCDAMKIPKHMLAMTAIFKLNYDSIEQPSDTLVPRSHLQNKLYTTISYTDTHTHLLQANKASKQASKQAAGIQSKLLVGCVRRLYLPMFWMKRHAVFLLILCRSMACVWSHGRITTNIHMYICVYTRFNLLMGYFIRFQ